MLIRIAVSTIAATVKFEDELPVPRPSGVCDGVPMLVLCCCPLGGALVVVGVVFAWLSCVAGDSAGAGEDDDDDDDDGDNDGDDDNDDDSEDIAVVSFNGMVEKTGIAGTSVVVVVVVGGVEDNVEVVVGSDVEESSIVVEVSTGGAWVELG